MHNIRDTYPECDKLGLEFVQVPGGEMPGYDAIEVEKALGAGRYADLVTATKNVFCCLHIDPRQPLTADGAANPAIYPADYHAPALRGCEVHCFYARDVENFLTGGK